MVFFHRIDEGLGLGLDQVEQRSHCGTIVLVPTTVDLWAAALIPSFFSCNGFDNGAANVLAAARDPCRYEG